MHAFVCSRPTSRGLVHEWNRQQGNRDATARSKLNFLGRCIKVCEPDPEEGAPPVHTSFRAKVNRAKDRAQLEASVVRETFFEPHEAMRVASFLDDGGWRRRWSWKKADVFLLLCATGMDIGELQGVTAEHLCKLTPGGKLLPWESRALWKGAPGYYAVDFGRGLTRADWRSPRSIASEKRRAAGIRLVPICHAPTGQTVADLALSAVDPAALLFAGLVTDTLYLALQRTCQRMDRMTGSTLCQQGTPNLKSCRRTFSQWGERSGAPQAFLRKVMGQYGEGAHERHYEALTAADAYQVAARIDSYMTEAEPLPLQTTENLAAE